MAWNEKRSYAIQKNFQKLSNHPKLSKEDRDFLANEAIQVERQLEFYKALIERKMEIADNILEKNSADGGIRKGMSVEEIEAEYAKYPHIGKGLDNIWREIKNKLGEPDKEKIDIILDSMARERELNNTWFFTELKKQKRGIFDRLFK